jgi:hypothetical protein
MYTLEKQLRRYKESSIRLIVDYNGETMKPENGTYSIKKKLNDFITSKYALYEILKSPWG